MLMTQDEIWELVKAERKKQYKLQADGRFQHTLADVPGLTDDEKLMCILEEVAEVAKVIMTARGRVIDGEDDLVKEIVQIIALSVAWLESLPSTKLLEDCSSQVGGTTGPKCQLAKGHDGNHKYFMTEWNDPQKFASHT